MRYQETGNVHLDFHGATNTTIDYIVEHYGAQALHEIFFRVGHDVYRSIRTHLEQGNTEELVGHWDHFFKRENADYDIRVTGEEITLTVRRCPAVHHVLASGLKLSPHFCDQTEQVNRGMTEGTPYTIELTLTGEGSCRQILRRRS